MLLLLLVLTISCLQACPNVSRSINCSVILEVIELVVLFEGVGVERSLESLLVLVDHEGTLVLHRALHLSHVQTARLHEQQAQSRLIVFFSLFSL